MGCFCLKVHLEIGAQVGHKGVGTLMSTTSKFEPTIV